MSFSLKVGGLDESAGNPRGAVSVTRGAESAARRIMWSVLFVFLSYLDRNFVRGDFLSRAVDVEKQGKEMFSMLNGTFCAKMSALGENFFYQVSDGTEMVRSVVSRTEKLVDCSITINHMQVKSFLHECRLGLKGQRAGWQLETRFAQKDEAKLMCKEFKKSSERSGVVKNDDANSSALQNEPLKRSKRGFTYPGTLWCGLGNMADDYDQLGDFAETDSCCRTHDHCPHVIHALSFQYGYFNFKWHSISHCDCDNALKDCLRRVNDTSSRVVGQAFFNVIGVSCFELVYEEQCKERHWYGLCKQYEKFQIAVVKEAAPYDFGGIDVIDELTVTPPRNKGSKKSQEEEKPESTPPSTMSGPEEPSLTNVVTAAEDFIKILATVSSSSSSSNGDSDKGETQSSEKKKRKNTGKKKTTKKQKGKEKIRKRKQKSKVSVRLEEGAAVSASGNKTKEVITLSNFINESHKHNQSSRNRYDDESKYDLGREDEPSNKVMEDEPAMDKERVSVASAVQKKPAKSDSGAPSASTRTVIAKAQNRRLSKERRKKKESQDTNTADKIGAIYVPAIITVRPTTKAQLQNLGCDTEKQPILSAVKRPVVMLKVKKDRSKEREDRAGRNKMRKVSSVSHIVSIGHKNSSLNTIPPAGAPTVPSVSTAEQQVSQRLCGRRLAVHTPPNLCFSVLRRQKMKEKELRNRRRKPILSFSNENLNNSEKRNTPENILLIPSDTSRLTEKSETLNVWKFITTAAPTITTKQHKHSIRQQRRPRKKVPAALSDGVDRHHKFTAMTLELGATEALDVHRSGKLYTTTTGAPGVSPIQLSVGRTKAQFTRKKKKKATHSVRQL